MTVEPVFGNLKANLGFRRFRLRGMAKAGAEFLLMCIGHDLGKLHTLMEGLRRAAPSANIPPDVLLSHVRRWLKGILQQFWHHKYCCPASRAA